MTNIGKVIYGFCNGYFGRDDYDDKIIIYETSTGIVCTYLEDDRGLNGIKPGLLTCANFETPEEKQQYIDEWSKKGGD